MRMRRFPTILSSVGLTESHFDDADVPQRRACVMCIGNVLLRDEGVGPEVGKQLMDRYQLPQGVDVLDCATMGMALLSQFRDYPRIVCVDAVDGTGQPPGTVVRFAPADMATRTQPPSAHDVRISDVMIAAQMLGYEPDVRCVGVQVLDMDPSDFSIGLTPQVQAAVPLAVQAVLAELWQLGVRDVVDKTTGQTAGSGDESR